MNTNRITNPLRLAKVLVGAAGAVIAVGLAAPAGADPVTTAAPTRRHVTPQDFLAAARAAGITGTDPAMLEDGYNVCWQLWNQHAAGYSGGRGPGAGLSTADHRPSGSVRAGRIPRPVPGARRQYDYWAYSTG